MTCNLILLIYLAFLVVYISERPVLYSEFGLIELKAVGGESSSELQDTSESDETSAQEKYSEEKSGRNDEGSYKRSKLDAGQECLGGISSGNKCFEKYHGNCVYSFASLEQLVKFILYESKSRDLGLDVSSSVELANIYCKSKFTPNTGKEGKITVSLMELLRMMRKFARTNGAYAQKPPAETPRDRRTKTSKITDTEQDYESHTESSSDSESESDKSVPAREDEHGSSERGSGSYEDKLKVPTFMERLYRANSPFSVAFEQQMWGSGSEFVDVEYQQNSRATTPSGQEGYMESPDKNSQKISGSDFGNSEEEHQTELKGMDDGRLSSTSERLNEQEMESGRDGEEDQVTQEEVIPFLDLRSRSFISFSGSELEIELKDPWRSFISMMLYEPVRRSTLNFDEEHCNKITKSAGRIIAYLIQISCKLRQILRNYKEKKCNKRNQFTKLFIGCYSLKNAMKKYFRFYSKLRYDLVDAVVGITQCSLAKNNYLSQSPIYLAGQEELHMIRCTIGEYYLSMDFQLFLSFIIDTYNSAEEKVGKMISSIGASPCPTKCRKRPPTLECLEKLLRNISADKANIEVYNSRLTERNIMCRNYLTNNYSFSKHIPESAEYITTAGFKRKVEPTSFIQVVQFPKYYHSDLEKLSIVRSSLLNFLLNSMNPRESPGQASTRPEKSPSKSAPKQTPKGRNRLKFRLKFNKNADKITIQAPTNQPQHPHNQNNWI
ncbi:hypothetical protein OJ253_1657 [Cryptosporidium canis]|uniref:Uncharacterized protein n=1 Tax=Cryptosporidium canis TaxID=195482 RepID=A0A9D5DJM3_9CRYT|nr:hypothetical protein OJ253_1657 [Cryptosporidium canis]